MDELSGDPHACHRLEKMRPFDEALSDGTAPNDFIEARDSILGFSDSCEQLSRKITNIVTHCSHYVFETMVKLSNH
ncbi:hypothetical protein QO004_004809 [Rhizobium mesoamericanum]|nr:hypothetical protein [Rhizobium mesoamericanum]